jgi:hypothetical protein
VGASGRRWRVTCPGSCPPAPCSGEDGEGRCWGGCCPPDTGQQRATRDAPPPPRGGCVRICGLLSWQKRFPGTGSSLRRSEDRLSGNSLHQLATTAASAWSASSRRRLAVTIAFAAEARRIRRLSARVLRRRTGAAAPPAPTTASPLNRRPRHGNDGPRNFRIVAGRAATGRLLLSAAAELEQKS